MPQPEFLAEADRARVRETVAPTDEELKTLQSYREIATTFSPPDSRLAKEPRPIPFAENRRWDELTDYEREFVAKNQEAIIALLEATERKSCANWLVLESPGLPTASLAEMRPTDADFFEFTQLLLLSARQLEAEGRLYEALQHYIAVLRLARHVAGRGGISEWQSAAHIVRRVSNSIGRWCGHESQTIEFFEFALSNLLDQIEKFRPLSAAYLVEQQRAQGPQGAELAFHIRRQIPPDSNWFDSIGNALLPGDRIRVRRIMNIVDAFECSKVEAQSFQRFQERRFALSPAKNYNRREFEILEGHDPGMMEWAYISPSINRVDTSKEQPFNADGLMLIDNLLYSTPLLKKLQYFQLNQFSQVGRIEDAWEREVRILLLQLKIARFRKEQGAFPDFAQFMSWGSLAINPVTGMAFGYMPGGFSTKVRVEKIRIQSGLEIEAERPFIWSAGSFSMREIFPRLYQFGNGNVGFVNIDLDARIVPLPE